MGSSFWAFPSLLFEGGNIFRHQRDANVYGAFESNGKRLRFLNKSGFCPAMLLLDECFNFQRGAALCIFQAPALGNFQGFEAAGKFSFAGAV